MGCLVRWGGGSRLLTFIGSMENFSLVADFTDQILR